jgi:hypothetical protein
MNKNCHLTHPRIIYLALLIVAGIVFFIFNLGTTLKGDDLEFLYTTSGEGLKKVQSLPECLNAIANQYHETNGRMANFLARLLCCMVDKSIFNIINALVFMLFLHVITRWIAHKNSPFVLALTLLFVLVLIPFPGETMLWITGATNYMWNVAFTLALLLFVRHRTDKPLTWKEGILLVPAAIITGQMGEIVTLPTLAAMFFYIILNKRYNDARLWLVLVAYAVGVALILVTPALWNRASNELHGGSPLVMIIGTARRYAAFIVPALAIVALVIVPFFKRPFKAHFSNIIVLSFIFSTLFLIALNDPRKDRLYFYAAILAFIILASYLYQWLRNRHKLLAIGTALLTLACIYPAFKANSAIRSYLAFHNQVEHDINATGPDCVLRTYQFPQNRWVAVAHYDSESFSTYNHIYRLYYNKKQILFLRDEAFEQYQKANFLEGAEPARITSSAPDIIDKLYVIPRGSFSIIPIKPENVLNGAMFLKFDLRPGDNRLTRGTAKQYALQGSLKEHNRLSFYHLTHQGNTYLMIPAVEDDVSTLSIPVNKDGKATQVTIQCNIDSIK